MPRLNTAADKELPKDLSQELWAAERVWVRRGSHMPPLSPLFDGPYKVLQRSLRHFRLQMGDREDNISTSRLKPSWRRGEDGILCTVMGKLQRAWSSDWPGLVYYTASKCQFELLGFIIFSQEYAMTPTATVEPGQRSSRPVQSF